MFTRAVVISVVASLVAAQLEIPSGTCVTQECSALINGIENCNAEYSTDLLNCLCSVYQKDIPGSCMSCFESISPEAGTDLQQALDACNSVQGGSLGSDVIPTDVSVATATSADAGGSTAAAATSANSHTSAKSDAGKLLIGTGFVGLAVLFGAALAGF